MTQNMSEDEIDDLLYLARIGDIEDFTSFSQELCTKYEYSKQQLVELARDPESGNGMLHMAAANGHLSKFRHSSRLQASHYSLRMIHCNFCADKQSFPQIRIEWHTHQFQSHISQRPKQSWEHTPPLGSTERPSRMREALARSWCGSYDQECSGT